MSDYFIRVIFYVAVVLLSVALLYQMIRIAEYTFCFFTRKIPFVPSSRAQRRAIVKEIKQHYPNARRICEIGSGYGGMARYIARRCNIDVIALEYMPVCVLFSRVADKVTFSHSRTIQCDAFEYLRRMETAAATPFDIAIAYMGPGVNDRIAEYRACFKTLILLDVPATDITPTRTISLKRGGTHYGRVVYPHKLFIYDF